MTGRPSRRARNGADRRTCRAMTRHRVVERARIEFSMTIFLDTAPDEAATSASSWRSTKVGGPIWPYVSWDRNAPVPVRPYLFHFNASSALADTPVPQAAVTITEDASGYVTHTSTTTGRLGRYRRRSPRWGPTWERGGSRVVPTVSYRWRSSSIGGCGGMNHDRSGCC